MTATAAGKLSVRNLSVTGRRVLVRCDLNVPLSDDCEVTDDTRIRASLPTIRHLVSEGARVILSSHLGRPKGQVVESMSLAPVASILERELARSVTMLPDCVGDEVSAAIAQMQDGDVVLLENVRFHAEETANDADFAKRLASNADLFVNDAFGTAHRAHASTVGVATHVEQSAAGFLLEKELEYLGAATSDPTRPYVAILGGSKISGKIDVLENLLEKVDAILIGGAMANTFFRSQGLETGDSLVEEDRLDMARELLGRATAAGVDLLLPVDCVVARDFAIDAERKTVGFREVESGWRMLDIGPKSVSRYRDVIVSAKTVLWNGPMGVFEMEPFAHGTVGIARALGDATAAGATTIVGGGDSAAAIAQAGLSGSVSHVSTGGGASLEFLEGKVLPGINALTEAKP